MSKLHTLAGELASIALAKKELTTKEEVIKEALLVEMHKVGITKESTDYGTASITTRKTYTFTEAIKKLENKVKIQKDKEIKQGLATVEEKQFISFRIATE